MFSVLLSFGSNLGDRHKTLNNAWHILGQMENMRASPTLLSAENTDKSANNRNGEAVHPFWNSIKTVRLSPFYETEPVGGPADQPKYINAVGIIQTTLPPTELLEILQKIESDFGRVRTEHWGARTLDIDILLYENHVVKLPILTIPHIEMLHRRFVLEPAKDIAADWVHPLTKKTIQEHWREKSDNFHSPSFSNW